MRILIAGYGNPSRCDDGAGWAAAGELRGLGLPGVEVRTTQQLHVEWAEEFLAYDCVYLIDADPGAGRACLKQVRPVRAAGGGSSHHLGAGTLASLALSLYGKEPLLFQCSIPAVETGFGETLSPQTKRGIREGVQLIAGDILKKKGASHA